MQNHIKDAGVEADEDNNMCHSDCETNMPKEERQETKWPEENPTGKPWILHVIDLWTYRYMDRILNLGSERALRGGANLAHSDLYRVPSSMKSEFLVEEFR